MEKIATASGRIQMTIETSTTDSVLGLAEAMTNMDGDSELLQEIIEIFMETAPPQLDAIAENIQTGDITSVAIQAHAMKGGASNFCARQFVASSLKLEQLAKGGNLDGAEALLARMREHFAEVSEVIKVINWEEVERNWQG